MRVFEILIIVVLLATLAVLALAVEPFEVNSSAMEPAFPQGSVCLANRYSYRAENPSRSDVVVYRIGQKPNFRFLGRIIGLPGERIKIQKGSVYVNDQKLSEAYLSAGTVTATKDRLQITDLNDTTEQLENSGQPKVIEEGQDLVMPKDSYFVMGDNRDISTDSRSLGLVSQADIVGGVVWCSTKAVTH